MGVTSHFYLVTWSMIVMTLETIHTVDWCELDKEFTGHIDVSSIEFNSSADGLFQQQQQCPDTSDTVDHRLLTSRHITDPITVCSRWKLFINDRTAGFQCILQDHVQLVELSWIYKLHPSWDIIDHFGDLLPSQSLDCAKHTPKNYTKKPLHIHIRKIPTN